ncbi:hypothetical protein B0T14DRAFT_523156 [Immersiella caudata]|uniref:Uncharacterized protein n=1 Tax=Immersiella caudata TaxID=314043 RepID=A0AA39WJA1_9PEZI|nr:hypothetical protein B0T14DRAFT_523156 [Immersiella caudata]
MASEPVPSAIDSTGKDTPEPELDRTFSNSQLKPAPLRLARKSQSSTEDASYPEDPVPNTDDAPQPEVLTTDGPVTPPARHAHTHFRTNQLPILELTPPPARQPAPSLVPIVSKYEVLEAISHIDHRAFSSPSSPRRHPRTPSQARPSPLSSQPQSIFREGSPFRKLPRLAVPASDRKSAHSERFTQVSPTTLTSPAALKGRLRSVAQKGKSPLPQRNDTKFEDGGAHGEDAQNPIKVLEGKEKHDVFVSPAAKPQGEGSVKRLSRPKTDEIVGWDPKLVAERRKVFERGKFTEPRVTRTTVPSNSIGYDARQDIVGSTLSPAKKHSHPVESRRSRLLLPQEPTSQRKWNSVADLRLSFEKASGSGTKQDITNASARVPLPTIDSASPSRAPITPRRRNVLTTTDATERLFGGHTAPSKYSRAGSKDEQTQHQQPADSLDRIPLRHSIPVGSHSVGLKQSSSAGYIPKNPGYLHTRRQIRSDRQDSNMTKSAHESAHNRSDREYPYLRPRILSVKISTADPNAAPEDPSAGDTDSRECSVDADRQGMPQLSKVQQLRTVFDRPQEPAVFLPFLQKNRRDTAPAKSGPSLPITVSTTVAVSTQRSSSHGSTSSGESVVVSTTADHVNHAKERSSLPSSRGELTDTPSRPPRNKLRKRRESPVKDRISMFESMTRPAGSSVSLPTGGRSKSYDSGMTPKFDKKRVPGWEFKRGSKMFRVLSFGSNKGATKKMDDKAKGVPKTVTAKSSLEAMKRHSLPGPNRPSKLSFLQSATARRESAIMVRGTVYKVSNHEESPEQPSLPTKASAPNTVVWSSTDLVNNTTETPPTLFHAASTRSGRILPTRKSYGALQPKGEWEATDDTAFTNPFRDASGATPDEDVSATECSLPSTIAESAASRGEAVTSPKRRSRYPSSFGRKAGHTLKRNAVGPILSPDEGRAVPTRRSSLSHSWGRRAAAAAFAIGRRIRERRTSGTRSLSMHGQEPSGGPPRPTSRDEEWDVFVATPNGGLQHPRPGRVVNFAKFEGYGGSRTEIQGPSSRL